MLLTDFETWLSKAKKSENTRAAYLSDVYAFLDYQGAAEVTCASVSAYFEYLVGIGRTGSTIKRVRAALKSYFDYMIACGELVTNPARDCDLPEADVSYTVAPPSEVAVMSLLDNVVRAGSHRDVVLLSLLSLTGATVSELQALNVGDIDMRMRTVTYGSRKIVLPSMTTQALHGLFTGSPHLNGDEPLFVGRTGARLTRQGIWLICKRWVEASELVEDLSPRLLRRGYVARLFEAGESHTAVKAIMGYAGLACVPC